jgi:hypothetical protein
MNQDALMLYFSKSLRMRRVCLLCRRKGLDDAYVRVIPVVEGEENRRSVAAVPLLMSLLLSSPPYEPIQPATASMSTPYLRRA